MKNVVLLSYQAYLHEALKIASRDVGVRLVFATSPSGNETHRSIDGAFYQAHFDSIGGRPESLYTYPSTELCKESQKYIYSCMGMLERHFSNGLNGSLRDYYQHIQKIFGFWEEIIKNRLVDLVIFEEEPHTVSDYIAYRVCKFYDIQCLLFSRLPNGRHFLAYEGIEEYEEPLTIEVNRLEEETRVLQRYLNSFEDHYIAQFSSSSEQCMLDKKRVKGIEEQAKATVIRCLEYISKSRGVFLNFLGKRGKIQHGTFSYQRRGSSYRQMSYLRFVLHKVIGTYRCKKARNAYEELSSEIDLSGKYIYFPLHFQPEKNTNPLGRIYDDQEYLVNRLLRCAPQDWKIVVKEHVQQFNPNKLRWSFRYRSREYYKRLLEDDRVVLANIDSNPFDLIDNSQLVATIAGTTGFEALARLKPVAMFGFPWYRSNRNACYIDNEEDLRLLIDRVEKNRIDINSFKANNQLFFEELKRKYFKGTVGGLGRNDMAVNELSDNIQSYAELLRAYLRAVP